MKIGICDYGIGGLGLYKILRSKTKADIVYISDSGFTPYGKVPEKDLRSRVQKVIDHFHSNGVQKIAVACNAASTVIPEDKNITGIIEHGMNMVFKLNPGKIGVVGGVRTIESEIFKTAFEKKGIATLQQIAQILSIRIEAGDVNSEFLEKDIEQIFEPLKDHKYILLACSHYSAIAEKINKFVKPSTLLNPDEEMASWILDNWLDHTGNSTTKWICSGNDAQMKKAAKISFGVEIDKLEHLDLT